MGRKKTYEKSTLDDMFDEFEEDEIKGEELALSKPNPPTPIVTSKSEENATEVTDIPNNHTVDTNEVEPEEYIEQTKPKIKSSKKKSDTKVNKIDFSKKDKVEDVPKAFRISPELDQSIKEMLSDGKGGKAEGSYGFSKAFANNALIKEMVFLGVLDESALDKLIPYK